MGFSESWKSFPLWFQDVERAGFLALQRYEEVLQSLDAAITKMEQQETPAPALEQWDVLHQALDLACVELNRTFKLHQARMNDAKQSGVFPPKSQFLSQHQEILGYSQNLMHRMNQSMGRMKKEWKSRQPLAPQSLYRNSGAYHVDLFA